MMESLLVAIPAETFMMSYLNSTSVWTCGVPAGLAGEVSLLLALFWPLGNLALW
jgi:hypothetical protein